MTAPACPSCGDLGVIPIGNNGGVNPCPCCTAAAPSDAMAEVERLLSLVEQLHSRAAAYGNKGQHDAWVEARTALLSFVRPYLRERDEGGLSYELQKAKLRESEHIRSLTWALDLIDKYDEFLIELGQPRERVYSDVHLEGKRLARAIVDASRRRP